jgi:hypothetical protein
MQRTLRQGRTPVPSPKYVALSKTQFCGFE